MKLKHFIIWLVVTYLVALVSLLVVESALIRLTEQNASWAYYALTVAMIVYTVYLGGIKDNKNKFINTCFNTCFYCLGVACIVAILFY